AYGYFTNPKVDPKNLGEGGTSDFVIEKVLKNHEFIKGQPAVTVPILMLDNKDKKYIIFCDVFKDNINPYRADEALPGNVLLDYFTSLMKLNDEPVTKRLRFCFDYLNSTDQAVSMDAYREFQKADDTDIRIVAKQLPAQAIVGWLSDPNTPTYRLGLYALLLGHCGNPKTHGDLLYSLIDNPKKREIAGIEGIMAGYVMLQPQEGWIFLQKILQSDKADEFNERYGALNTLRFFWDNRHDALSKQQILQGVTLALAVPDIADFAMDDLRIWKQWDMTDKVLDLFKKPSHDSPIIDRAILRFALCSKTPRAVEFVAAQRKRDPVWVSDTEEVLRADEAILNLAPANKK
ncbi:MAG TPA: hypothetical protein VE988_15230, partial [Gemmataceae bacterium]|nr:hypothetical protein [Gemmataceae bacterium]